MNDRATYQMIRNLSNDISMTDMLSGSTAYPVNHGSQHLVNCACTKLACYISIQSETNSCLCQGHA